MKTRIGIIILSLIFISMTGYVQNTVKRDIVTVTGKAKAQDIVDSVYLCGLNAGTAMELKPFFTVYDLGSEQITIKSGTNEEKYSIIGYNEIDTDWYKYFILFMEVEYSQRYEPPSFDKIVFIDNKGVGHEASIEFVVHQRLRRNFYVVYADIQQGLEKDPKIIRIDLIYGKQKKMFSNIYSRPKKSIKWSIIGIERDQLININYKFNTSLNTKVLLKSIQCSGNIIFELEPKNDVEIEITVSNGDIFAQRKQDFYSDIPSEMALYIGDDQYVIIPAEGVILDIKIEETLFGKKTVTNKYLLLSFRGLQLTGL